MENSVSHFAQVAQVRSLFSQGTPSERRQQQESARTESRQNLGALLTPTRTTATLPTSVTVPPDAARDMAQLQALRLQNREQRQQRSTMLAERVAIEQASPSVAPAAASQESNVSIFEGHEYHCSICLEDAVEHDRVCRLACRHVFHANCWEGMHDTTLTTCPNCRAEATVIAIWHYIGPRPSPTQGQPNLLDLGTIDGNVQLNTLTTPRSVTTDYEFGTPSSSDAHAFPTFPATQRDANNWNGAMTMSNQPNVSQQGVPQAAQAAGTAQAYISNTELADGRQALLVDVGSWGCLTGGPWARRTATLAKRSGRAAKQTQRSEPLQVSGVGKDAQTCTHDCELPIELTTIDGRSIPGIYTAPTLKDDHALPALLGLRTLVERRAIIDLPNMQISFTGQGETKINYSPGTDTFKMYHAPSGHLMLPCCEYSAKQRQDLMDHLALLTDTEITPGASSSASEPHFWCGLCCTDYPGHTACPSCHSE